MVREHFYPAHERGLGNEILPPSKCPFLHFRLLTIRYLIQPLRAFDAK